MSTMELDPAQLFDGFPEPVLLLEEGTVRYRNPAAGRVFPGLREGDRAPEELAVPTDAEFPIVCTGRVGARSFRMSVQDVGREGLLAVLRPEHEAAAGPRLEKLALRLRQETAGLAASLQRLEPAGGESDQKKREKYLAAANQGLYRLLRLADHLEFADARDQDLYRPAPLDMAGFCRELFREVESVCAMSGYRFSYETELVTLLTVGDEALLRRLVLSLVSNAMKAAGAGARWGRGWPSAGAGRCSRYGTGGRGWRRKIWPGCSAGRRAASPWTLERAWAWGWRRCGASRGSTGASS